MKRNSISIKCKKFVESIPKHKILMIHELEISLNSFKSNRDLYWKVTWKGFIVELIPQVYIITLDK